MGPWQESKYGATAANDANTNGCPETKIRTQRSVQGARAPIGIPPAKKTRRGILARPATQRPKQTCVRGGLQPDHLVIRSRERERPRIAVLNLSRLVLPGLYLRATKKNQIVFASNAIASSRTESRVNTLGSFFMPPPPSRPVSRSVVSRASRSNGFTRSNGRCVRFPSAEARFLGFLCSPGVLVQSPRGAPRARGALPF